MSETPTPDPAEQNQSAEQLAIGRLSQTVRNALDAHGVAQQPLDGGGYTRTITSPTLSTLTETVTAEGTKSYAYGTLFSQSHDRGSMQWSWRDGDDKIEYNGDFEVKSKESKTVDDKAGIALTQSNVEYCISTLSKPEKSASGRTALGRTLGRLAVWRR